MKPNFFPILQLKNTQSDRCAGLWPKRKRNLPRLSEGEHLCATQSAEFQSFWGCPPKPSAPTNAKASSIRRKTKTATAPSTFWISARCCAAVPIPASAFPCRRPPTPSTATAWPKRTRCSSSRKNGSKNRPITTFACSTA